LFDACGQDCPVREDPTAVLAFLLRTEERRSQFSLLALVDAVQEVSGWLRHGRQDSWERNANNLLNDYLRPVESIGQHLADACDPHLAEFTAAIRALAERRAGTVERRREAASNAEALVAVLRSPRGRRACWRDLIDSVVRGDPPRLQRHKAAQLLGTTAHAGHDVIDLARHLVGVLEDNPFAIAHETGEPLGDKVTFLDKPGTSVSERLRMCEEAVGREPVAGRCIVWLSYTPAELETPVLELGGVILYEARWAVPNARSDSGQAFPFRHELRLEINGMPKEIENDDAHSRVVLARVDLGHSPLACAIDRARAVVEMIVQTAAFDSGGVGWEDYGYAMVLLDGQWRQSMHGVGGRATRLRHLDRQGWLATSEELTRQSAAFTAALIRDELDDNLREAFRCITESRNADSRSSVLLADRAVELVAGYESVSADELITAAAAGWPRHRLTHDVFYAITSLLDGARSGPNTDEAETLAQRIQQLTTRRRSIDLRDVAANSNDLRRLARGSRAESEVLWALGVLDDPLRALAALREASADKAALLARWRRVRNALTHGNPATQPAIDSVSGFAVLIGSTVARYALDAVATGSTTRLRLDAVVKDDADFRQRLDNGEDLISASRPEPRTRS
jgi:hypothetical protein